jgi:hypothetical protein
MISRKRTQINPRFLGLPTLGGIAPWPVTGPSGSDSGILVVVDIPEPIKGVSKHTIKDRFQTNSRPNSSHPRRIRLTKRPESRRMRAAINGA